MCTKTIDYEIISDRSEQESDAVKPYLDQILTKHFAIQLFYS